MVARSARTADPMLALRQQTPTPSWTHSLASRSVARRQHRRPVLGPAARERLRGRHLGSDHANDDQLEPFGPHYRCRALLAAADRFDLTDGGAVAPAAHDRRGGGTWSL